MRRVLLVFRTLARVATACLLVQPLANSGPIQSGAAARAVQDAGASCYGTGCLGDASGFLEAPACGPRTSCAPPENVRDSQFRRLTSGYGGHRLILHAWRAGTPGRWRKEKRRPAPSVTALARRWREVLM